MTTDTRTVPGWDDGPHQSHAPRRGPDPLALFIIVAAFAVTVLALWRRS